MTTKMRITNAQSKPSIAVGRDLQRLKQTAGQAVGSVFFGTLLKMMRESPLKGKFGHGGRGEEVFAGQLDGVLAERAGTAMKRGVGDVLYARLSHQQELISAAREKQNKARELERG